MRTDELDFHLPADLIAQTPADKRSASRLLHFNRQSGAAVHRHFADLPSLLRPGDLLVFNNARVLPARFSLIKPTGGHIEGLFLGEGDGEAEAGQWTVMLKNAGSPGKALELAFLDDPSVKLTINAKLPDGTYQVTVTPPVPAADILGRLGRMPLPPYIHRAKDHDPRDQEDRRRYQTVYADAGHAVAAPTAGLHFTPGLLGALAARGVESAYLTLNVGLGTFKPVSADRLEDHPMHTESYTIPPAVAAQLNRAKQEQRRVIAVGTTSARVLESQASGDAFVARSAETNIFIYPPYQWKHVSALVTNFHLPRSTLIALVAAFVGLEKQRELYRIAIEHGYRFFSYGDAMFLE